MARLTLQTKKHAVSLGFFFIVFYKAQFVLAGTWGNTVQETFPLSFNIFRLSFKRLSHQYYEPDRDNLEMFGKNVCIAK